MGEISNEFSNKKKKSSNVRIKTYQYSNKIKKSDVKYLLSRWKSLAYGGKILESHGSKKLCLSIKLPEILSLRYYLSMLSFEFKNN